MARQKNYDRLEAVSKAADAFRKYGYQNLGVRAIEEQVGIGRFAIRTDFGGKEGLFKEALAYYSVEYFGKIIQPIRDAKDLTVLWNIFDQDQEDNRLIDGCLLVNTMIETPTHQYPEFNVYTQKHFDMLHRAVSELLDRAKANGMANININSNHAAEFIKGALITINVMNRDANNLIVSKGYIDMVLATIASWKIAP